MARLANLFGLVPFLIAAAVLAPAGDAGARTRPQPRAEKVRVARKPFGGELVIRGGPAFRPFAANYDALAGREEHWPRYSFGAGVEVHYAATERFSVDVGIHFTTSDERWRSVVSGDRPDLALAWTRVHLFHVGIKARPFLRRVSPYLAVAVGPDLIGSRLSVGAFGTSYVDVGLGVQAGGGVDVFVTPRVAVNVDVRNALTVHRPHQIDDYVDAVQDDGSTVRTTYYEAVLGPVEDTIDVSLGVLVRL